MNFNKFGCEFFVWRYGGIVGVERCLLDCGGIEICDILLDELYNREKKGCWYWIGEIRE